ncbi:hypothetical protein F4678DRAFT_467209 [Xylaria arbuscula]|nr:hypothetical protein F4678DRAFT_467209 [Xylaria arbuscula]
MAFDQARDLRSVAHDTKRVNDHKHKWAGGSCPLYGVVYDWRNDEWTGSESQQEKVRPIGRGSNGRRHSRAPNVTKHDVSARSGGHYPQSTMQPKASIVTELQDSSNLSRSLHELLSSPSAQRKQSVSDDFLYSFDRSDSPGKPLSLEVFVKTNPRETEKFVEKEYEILDYKGDAVKGRKALKDLHRGKTAAPSQQPELIVEDEGFELV